MAPPNQTQSSLSSSSDLTQADQNRLNNASLKPLPPSLDNLLVPNPAPTAATNANNPSPSGVNNSSTPKVQVFKKKLTRLNWMLWHPSISKESQKIPQKILNYPGKRKRWWEKQRKGRGRHWRKNSSDRTDHWIAAYSRLWGLQSKHIGVALADFCQSIVV